MSTLSPEISTAAAPARERASALVPRLAAAERDHDLAGRYAADNIRLVAEAGLLAINVPADHGGLGEHLSGTTETLRILAQGSPSTALMLTMHTAILANYLIDERHVPAAERAFFVAQREWAFREAVAGKIFGVANSEVGAGGNVKNSKAELRADGLHGLKSFCSMGVNADYFMAAARGEGGTVDYYLVRNDGQSVRAEGGWDAMGMRSSESVSLRFAGAPVVDVLGYRGMLDGVNNRHWSTLSFTAIFVGVAESLLADVGATANGILQESSSVDLHLTIEACRAFVRHCVAVEPDPADAAYRKLVRNCKLYVTRTLAEKGTASYLALGGSAYRFASPISRKLRDLLAGPALRPPVGVGFDELWEELRKKEEGSV